MQNNYIPSEYITIDEVLVEFGGKCSFRQHIPNKPAKYIIKIHSLCDAKTFYVWNMEIYVGTQPEGPYKADKQYNSSQAVVTKLISDISGFAGYIIFVNWCASISIPLVESLLCDHNLTAVGTLKKNKREISEEFLVIKNRPPTDSMFDLETTLHWSLICQTSRSKRKMLY